MRSLGRVAPRRARAPLPHRRGARLPEPVRGLRPAAARGDGLRLPGRVLERGARCRRSVATPHASSTRARPRRSPPPIEDVLREPDGCRAAGSSGPRPSRGRRPRAPTTRSTASCAVLTRRSAATSASTSSSTSSAKSTRRLPSRAARAPWSRRRRGRAAPPCPRRSDSSMPTCSRQSSPTRENASSTSSSTRVASRRSRRCSRPARPAAASATSRARSRRAYPQSRRASRSPSAESLLEPERDRRRAVRDLAREEVERPPRRLVVVEDPERGVQPVAAAVAAGDEVAVRLGDAVRGQRRERRLLGLRRLGGLAEDLARRRLVEADRRVDLADRLEQRRSRRPQRTRP